MAKKENKNNSTTIVRDYIIYIPLSAIYKSRAKAKTKIVKNKKMFVSKKY